MTNEKVCAWHDWIEIKVCRNCKRSNVPLNYIEKVVEDIKKVKPNE